MKPYILTMQAFGPFEVKTTIDFTKFNNSLFLITGKTGSGKSTIFDALMYALFGETSGKERTPKDMRTQNVDAKVKTVITLEFEHNSRRYQIKRTISGRKTASEDAIFWNDDGSIVERTKAVNAAIENILGIEADQFRMIAMLPQGKFRELLTAKSENKSEILKKLFDTRIYALLQNKLKERDSAFKDEREHFEEEICAKITLLKVPEDNSTYTWLSEYIEKPSVSDSNLEALFANLHKLVADDAAHIEQISIQIQNLSLERERTDQEIGKVEDNNNLLNRATDARDALNALLPQEERYNALKTAIKRVHAAERILATDTAYQHTISLRKRLEITIEENTKIVSEIEPMLKNIEQELNKLEKNQEIKDAIEKRDTLKATLPTYQKLIVAEQEHMNLGKRISETKLYAASIDTEITKLIILIQNQERREKDLVAVDVELNETKNQLEKLRQKRNTLNELDALIDTLKKSETVLAIRQEECRRSKEDFNIKNTIANTLQLHYLDGQAGILADSLEDGTPCPVCGALTHPAPAQRLDNIPERTEVITAKMAADAAQKQWTKKSNIAATAKSERNANEEVFRKLAGTIVKSTGKIDEIIEQIMEYNRNLIKENEDLLLKSSKLSTLVTEKKTIAENLPKLRDEMAIKSTEKSNAENTYSTCLGQILSLEQTIADFKQRLPYPTKSEAEKVIQELNRNIEHFDEEYTFLSNHKLETYKKLSQATGIIQRTQADLAVIKQDESKTHSVFIHALETNSFSSIEEYRIALQNIQTVAEMESNAEDFFKRLDIAKEASRKAEELCYGRSYMDLGLLTARQKELSTELHQLNVLLSAYQARNENNKRIADIILSTWNQKKSREKLHTAVHKLAETANGMVTGQERLDLERYIQAVYFTEILRFANKQLLTMSNNRYTLIRPENASTLRGKSGLELAVTDRFTGHTREITTLSGGESFLAALALALGLSEMIQHLSGGISIDALFVDEGFDTLDTDALQDVLKVLWTLTTGNRVVGIISHRGELRDQLDHKIIVTKLGNGRSTLDPKY